MVAQDSRSELRVAEGTTETGFSGQHISFAVPSIANHRFSSKHQYHTSLIGRQINTIVSRGAWDLQNQATDKDRTCFSTTTGLVRVEPQKHTSMRLNSLSPASVSSVLFSTRGFGRGTGTVTNNPPGYQLFLACTADYEIFQSGKSCFFLLPSTSSCRSVWDLGATFTFCTPSRKYTKTPFSH